MQELNGAGKMMHQSINRVNILLCACWSVHWDASIVTIVFHNAVWMVSDLTNDSVTPYSNETPTVRGLAANKNNKLYTETMIFLWNNQYNLNFNV